MGQGWKMLPLIVFLLLWRTADGLKRGVYSNSDISEAHVTETLPVGEVGSTLFPQKSFRSRSKLNLLQFVKGGSSSDQSVSHDRTAPSSYASASLPPPLVQRPSSSLMSGSTVPGVASQLNLGTQYAARDSGFPIYRGSSYPAVPGISGHSNRDTLQVASSKGILMLQSAEAPLPVFSQSTSYSSSSAPGAASTSQSTPVLHSESSGQPLYPQGEGSLSKWASTPYTSDSSTKLSSTISHLSSGKQSTPSWFNSRSPGVSGTFLSSGSVHSIPTQVGSYSGVSQSLTPSSQYTPGSLMSNKLDASRSTNSQSSPIVSTSNTQSRSSMPLVTSSHVPVQGSSSSTRLSLKPPGTLGEYTPISPTKYISGPTSSRTSHSAVSPVGSLSQMESSGVFPSRGGNYYSGLLPPSQANSGKYALGYSFLSKPISSPQSTSSQSASVSNSRKPYISAFQDTTGAQFGAWQGMSSPSSGSVPSSVSSSVYCKCALSPLDVDSQTTTVHHSSEHFASNSDTQSESSTPFTLQGSITYDGPPQQKAIASQFAPVSHSFSSASSQSSTVQDLQEPLPSTDTGSSGTQAGSSTPFTLQHTISDGSPQPQHTSQFSPGLPSYPSLSFASPLGVASQSASKSQFTSASRGSSMAPLGASALFAPGSTSSRYSGSVQSQDAASQFAPGSKPSYTSLSVSFPKADSGPSLQSSRKPFTSTFTGSSGTQAGSSTPFTLLHTASSGSSPPQNNANQFSPGWPSSYHGVSSSLGVASPSSLRKTFTSTFTGSSGTQAGSSFTLQGSSASGGSSTQGATGQFVPGSSSASVSSSPQSVGSQSSQPQRGSSVSQRWQPSSTHWTQGVPTSDAGAPLGSSSSPSSPIQFSSQSSAGGSTSRVSSLSVSASRGSTSHDGSFQSQSSSTKYTTGSQVLPYDPSVAAQGTSSVFASEVLSGSSSLNNQNAPAPSRSSSSRRVYSVKG
ncbi:flocculation protein FLO11-like [Carassius auratus]|uniref:Flocculation protein FLO11-like n=1 Tax=Carassius auratus TaxID=7957 RepID=A0A6P6Q6Z3_CARAU|nr:flocculation protein FLO11-like [Carassius auratus]